MVAAAPQAPHERRVPRRRPRSSAFGAIGIGIAILVQTARHGGGLGYLIGVLFVALGAGRLYLLRRRQ